MSNLKSFSRRAVIASSLLCCLAFQVASFAAGPGPGAQNRVTVADGRVSFVPPPGFKPLTKEQISRKFPRGNPPQHVFANESQSVSVAVTLSAARLAPEQLEEFKAAMEQMLPRGTPGLVWITREFVTFGGRRWMHLEMTSTAIDTDIHNHMYATSFAGQALFFNFNATVKDYPAAKESLMRSVRSITLQDN